MKLHELKPAEGSKRARRRVGRGRGSGMGKQSTRCLLYTSAAADD